MIENRNLAAERAVLAGVAKYGQAGYMEVADIITRQSFTLETNQIFYHIFEEILKQEKSSVDLATILAMANTIGHKELFAKEDNKSLLRAILNCSINQENLRKLAATIRKLEIARLLRLRLKWLDRELEQVTGDEPVENILGIAENSIFSFATELNSKSSDEPEDIGNGLAEYKDYLLANRGRSIGIPSGFSQYDTAIGGGFRPGISVVGARLKTGKTVFADNVALHVAGKLRIPVLYLDTEMSKDEHWIRLMANLSSMKQDYIEGGLFYDTLPEKNAYDKAEKFIQDMPYKLINIFGKSTEAITSIIRRWLIKCVGFEDNGHAKPCLVILDYIKLMEQTNLAKNIAEHQALGFFVSALHDFAKEYHVPFLAFAQLNRDGINQEDSGAFSGSDRIGWFALNLAIFKKKTEEEIAEDTQYCKERYNRKLFVTDARHGAGMECGDYLNMKFEGAYARITEGKTRDEIYANKQPTGTIVEGTAESETRASNDDNFAF